MTARVRGHNKSKSTSVYLSPELRAVFKLVSVIVGENALHHGSAQETLRTISALMLCDFRSDRAALMLNVSAETVRMRVHRIRQRIQGPLANANYVIPVRPSISQNEERWSPETFDEHAELSTAEAEAS